MLSPLFRLAARNLLCVIPKTKWSIRSIPNLRPKLLTSLLRGFVIVCCCFGLFWSGVFYVFFFFLFVGMFRGVFNGFYRKTRIKNTKTLFNKTRQYNIQIIDKIIYFFKHRTRQ